MSKKECVVPDILVDTSISIALVVAGHEKHRQTLEAVDGLTLGLSGHAWFETFSVLTRLPPPIRRSPEQVFEIVEENFPGSRFLSATAASSLRKKLLLAGIAGGSIYDALVAAAAQEHNLPLASRDHRALRTYRSFDLDLRMVG